MEANRDNTYVIDRSVSINNYNYLASILYLSKK